MKLLTKNLVSLLAFFWIIQTIISCAAAVIAPFIPLIAAAEWVNTADPTKQNVFFFNVDTPNSNTSTFSGNENLTAGGQAPFNGSFTDHSIEFSYDEARTTKKGKYTGSINDASSEMTLTSTTLPPITLRKK